MPSLFLAWGFSTKVTIAEPCVRLNERFAFFLAFLFSFKHDLKHQHKAISVLQCVFWFVFVLPPDIVLFFVFLACVFCFTGVPCFVLFALCGLLYRCARFCFVFVVSLCKTWRNSLRIYMVLRSREIASWLTASSIFRVTRNRVGAPCMKI